MSALVLATNRKHSNTEKQKALWASNALDARYGSVIIAGRTCRLGMQTRVGANELRTFLRL